MTNFKDGLYTVTQEKTHRVIKILGIKIKIRSPQIETPEPVDYLSQTNDTPITIERCRYANPNNISQQKIIRFNLLQKDGQNNTLLFRLPIVIKIKFLKDEFVQTAE